MFRSVIEWVVFAGVSSRSSAKKSPSSHSLHYDGNFPMQMQKDSRSHLRRYGSFPWGGGGTVDRIVIDFSIISRPFDVENTLIITLEM